MQTLCKLFLQVFAVSFVATVNIFAATLTFLVYNESKTVFIPVVNPMPSLSTILFFATFIINIGLIAGVSYSISLFIVPWILYYSALFLYWFFSRIPSLQSDVNIHPFFIYLCMNVQSGVCLKKSD